MNEALARARDVPTLAYVAYGLMAVLFLIGVWTADRPVMAVAVLGVFAVSLAWWVSS
jgi:hypothetical protein